MDSSNADLAPLVAEPGNTLFLTPSLDERRHEVCSRLVGPPGEQQRATLAVLLGKSPDQWLNQWRAKPQARSGPIAIVGVGEATRSATAQPGGAVGQRQYRIETVSDPRDLTGIGIKINDALSWLSTESDLAVCFDSLTVLLQYSDLQRTFRFLHVLTGRLTAADARAHFHLDPDAHDDQTIATLTSLFDSVVEPTDEGWRVRNR
ncbi:hypothetical protein ACFQH6_08300 [Halobacteriaceae archaeon GCM10025711]